MGASESDERLFRVVRGAVRMLIHAHPEYFTEIGLQRAERSLTKRVAGALQSSREGASARVDMDARTGFSASPAQDSSSGAED